MAELMESTKELSPQQRLKSTNRNDACPCGSGKKYKKCHLAADEAEESSRLDELLKQAQLARAAEEAAAEEEEETSEAGPTKKKSQSAVSTGKSKRTTQSSGKGSSSATRPNNLPRRKAV